MLSACVMIYSAGKSYRAHRPVLRFYGTSRVRRSITRAAFSRHALKKRFYLPVYIYSHVLVLDCLETHRIWYSMHFDANVLSWDSVFAWYSMRELELVCSLPHDSLPFPLEENVCGTHCFGYTLHLLEPIDAEYRGSTLQNRCIKPCQCLLNAFCPGLLFWLLFSPGVNVVVSDLILCG